MVPFKWEEKPGKPLPSFSYSQGDSPVLPRTYSPVLPLPPSKLIGFTRSSGYSPHSSPIKVGAKLKTLFSRIINYEEEDIGDVDNNSEPKVDQEDGVLKEESEDVAEEDTGEVDDDKEENDSEPNEHHQDGSLKDDNAEEEEDDDATDDNGEGEEEMLELDAEATNFGKSESSRSVMSLLANCCIAQEDISNAIPVEQYLMEEEISHIQHESPTSPLFASETESYFSSNATESRSSSSSSRLTGSSSFFECFFPQFSPDPGYLDNADSHEESALIPPHLVESNLPLRTPTLGELIRVSCRGFRTRNPSLDFMKKGFGSCISETGDKACP